MDSTIDLTSDNSILEEDDDVIITGVTLPNEAPIAQNESDAGETAQQPTDNGRQILIAEEIHASRHADHNMATYQEMKAGDLVEFHRGLYTHWAVCIGDGHVIHLSGEDDDGLSTGSVSDGSLGSVSGTLFTIAGVSCDKAKVKCDNFWDVARVSKANINNSKDSYIRADAPHLIVDRALSRMGVIGYNLLWSNCEHFASWCRYGMAWSEQVDKWMRLIHRGGEMLTNAMMTLGFVPARLKPYQAPDSEDDDRQERRFPEIDFFHR